MPAPAPASDRAWPRRASWSCRGRMTNDRAEDLAEGIAPASSAAKARRIRPARSAPCRGHRTGCQGRAQRLPIGLPTRVPAGPPGEDTGRNAGNAENAMPNHAGPAIRRDSDPRGVPPAQGACRSVPLARKRLRYRPRLDPRLRGRLGKFGGGLPDTAASSERPGAPGYRQVQSACAPGAAAFRGAARGAGEFHLQHRMSGPVGGGLR